MARSLVMMFQLASLSYGDARRMLKNAWLAVLIVTAVQIATGLAVGVVVGWFRTNLAIWTIVTLGSVAADWINAPYLSALTRFVLTDRYKHPSLTRRDLATERYFAWSAVFSFISAAPALASWLLIPRAPDTDGLPRIIPAADFLTLGLSALAGIFLIRTITLLPATALGRRETIGEAMTRTRGQFWFIFGAFVMVSLPFILARLVLRADHSLPLLTAALSILISAALVLIGLALAARVYQKLTPVPET
jgi:hypothetical protein